MISETAIIARSKRSFKLRDIRFHIVEFGIKSTSFKDICCEITFHVVAVSDL